MTVHSTMPHASGPETPPSTAPKSPTSPTTTNDFIDCEKGSVDEDEEVIEEINEKGSQDGFSNYGRPKLVQRSKAASYA